MTISPPISLSSTYLGPSLPRSHLDHIITSNCSYIISVSHTPLSNYHHLSAQLIILSIQFQLSFHRTQTDPISFPHSGPCFSPNSAQLPWSFITSIIYLYPQLSCPNNFNSHSCYLLTNPRPGGNPTLHPLRLHQCS